MVKVRVGIWVASGILAFGIHMTTSASLPAGIGLLVGAVAGEVVGRRVQGPRRLSQWTARLIAATAALAVLAGLAALWAIAMTETNGDLPPPLEEAAADAEAYRHALAANDFESYRDVVEANVVLGITIEQAFEVERTCIDWSAVTISIEPHGISPFSAGVTFAAGEQDLVRSFNYQSGRWVVTADAKC